MGNLQQKGLKIRDGVCPSGDLLEGGPWGSNSFLVAWLCQGRELQLLAALDTWGSRGWEEAGFKSGEPQCDGYY